MGNSFFISDNSTEQNTSRPEEGTEAPWEASNTTEQDYWWQHETTEEPPVPEGEDYNWDYPTKEPIDNNEENEIPDYGGNDV